MGLTSHKYKYVSIYVLALLFLGIAVIESLILATNVIYKRVYVNKPKKISRSYVFNYTRST